MFLFSWKEKLLISIIIREIATFIISAFKVGKVLKDTVNNK